MQYIVVPFISADKTVFISDFEIPQGTHNMKKLASFVSNFQQELSNDYPKFLAKNKQWLSNDYHNLTSAN